ncbi:MAG: hypothetical protein ABI323_04570, partial [Solirubrobacteraceae bacterium]
MGARVIGALLSPVLVGAPATGLTTAILGVAATGAMAVTVAQGWSWLGLAAVLVCGAQWGWFLVGGQSIGIDLAVLSWFGTIGLAGAAGLAGSDRRAGLDRIEAGLTLAATSGGMVAILGYLVLAHDSGPLAAGRPALAGGARRRPSRGGQPAAGGRAVTTGLRRLLSAMGVL